MAKIDNILGIQGTISGINIYKLNGEWVARAAGGGFTREAIKKKESMGLVRKQNEEFALASKSNRILRRGFRGLHGTFKITYLHSRLQGVMQQLKKLDTTSRFGERDAFVGMVTPEGLATLNAFEYTPDAPWNTTVPYIIQPLGSSLELSMQLKPQKWKSPLAATHIGFRMAVLELHAEDHEIKTWQTERVCYDLKTLPETLTFVTDAPLERVGPRLVYVSAWYQQKKDEELFALRDKKTFSMACVGASL
ncbi:MAG: hypothetical protein R2786_11315 [Flavobacteriaceae bacterium]